MNVIVTGHVTTRFSKNMGETPKRNLQNFKAINVFLLELLQKSDV